MYITKNYVGIVLNGFRLLNTKNDAEEFFKMLNNLGREFIPARIGMCEPIITPYTVQNAKDMWVNSSIESNGYGHIFFESKTISGDISWSPDTSNQFGCNISLSALKDYQKLIDFLKQLFIWLNGVYGYGFHFLQIGNHYTPGYSFYKCIGDITWMALFGPPYVKMFGRETVKTAPCIVEEFTENCFLLFTSKEPQKLDHEILERQQRVKQHLGEDAFYKGNPDTLDDEEGMVYRAPDLSGYWK